MRSFACQRWVNKLSKAQELGRHDTLAEPFVEVSRGEQQVHRSKAISRGLSKNLGCQQTQAGLNRDVNQHAIIQSRRISMTGKIGSCSLNPDTALTTYTSIAFCVPVTTIEQGCRHLLCTKTSSQRKSSVQIKGLLEDCVCPAFRYPKIFFHC